MGTYCPCDVRATSAVAIGQIARFLLLGLLLFRFFFAVGDYLFFMPIADEPALNDVSELDNRRDFLGCWHWLC